MPSSYRKLPKPNPRLSDAEVARIAESEIAAFTDDRFGGVDMPKRIGEQTGDVSWRDDRFLDGPSDRPPLKDFMTGQPLPAEREAGSLVEFLEQAGSDQDVINDPDMKNFAPVAEELYQQASEKIAIQFMQANAGPNGYYRSDDNYSAIVQYLAQTKLFRDDLDDEDAARELFNRGFWTVQELTAAFRYLLGRGALDEDPHKLRHITEHDVRELAQQANSGDLNGAIINYWLRRLPQAIADELGSLEYSECVRVMSDPKYKAVALESVFLILEAGAVPGTLDYSPTPARRDFIIKFIGQRFPTVALAVSAWQQLKQIEARQNFQPLRVPETEPSAENFDSLDDEQVAALYSQTMRAASRRR